MSSPSPDKSARQALMIARGLSRGVGLASGGDVHQAWVNGFRDRTYGWAGLTNSRAQREDMLKHHPLVKSAAEHLKTLSRRAAEYQTGPSISVRPEDERAIADAKSRLDGHIKAARAVLKRASGGDVRGSWDRITGKQTAWPDEDMPEDSMPLPSLSKEDFREPRTQRNPFERAAGGETKALTQAMNRFAQARQAEFDRERAGILSSDPWLRASLPASDNQLAIAPLPQAQKAVPVADMGEVVDDGARMLGVGPGKQATPPAIAQAGNTGAPPSVRLASPSSAPVPSSERYTGSLSPSDRDLMIRTIAGEAGNQGPEGQAAVASVILNRAMDSRWGKNGVRGVILAPAQFSTWNKGDPAGDYARKLNPNGSTYQEIGDIVDGVSSGKIADPTGGATHFYAPAGGYGMQPGTVPRWAAPLAAENDVTIGGHRFLGKGNFDLERPEVASPPIKDTPLHEAAADMQLASLGPSDGGSTYQTDSEAGRSDQGTPINDDRTLPAARGGMMRRHFDDGGDAGDGTGSDGFGAAVGEGTGTVGAAVGWGGIGGYGGVGSPTGAGAPAGTSSFGGPSSFGGSSSSDGTTAVGPADGGSSANVGSLGGISVAGVNAPGPSATSYGGVAPGGGSGGVSGAGAGGSSGGGSSSGASGASGGTGGSAGGTSGGGHGGSAAQAAQALANIYGKTTLSVADPSLQNNPYYHLLTANGYPAVNSLNNTMRYGNPGVTGQLAGSPTGLTASQLAVLANNLGVPVAALSNNPSSLASMFAHSGNTAPAGNAAGVSTAGVVGTPSSQANQSLLALASNLGVPVSVLANNPGVMAAQNMAQGANMGFPAAGITSPSGHVGTATIGLGPTAVTAAQQFANALAAMRGQAPAPSSAAAVSTPVAPSIANPGTPSAPVSTGSVLGFAPSPSTVGIPANAIALAPAPVAQAASAPSAASYGGWGNHELQTASVGHARGGVVDQALGIVRKHRASGGSGTVTRNALATTLENAAGALAQRDSGLRGGMASQPGDAQQYDADLALAGLYYSTPQTPSSASGQPSSPFTTSVTPPPSASNTVGNSYQVNGVQGGSGSSSGSSGPPKQYANTLAEVLGTNTPTMQDIFGFQYPVIPPPQPNIYSSPNNAAALFSDPTSYGNGTINLGAFNAGYAQPGNAPTLISPAPQKYPNSNLTYLPPLIGGGNTNNSPAGPYGAIPMAIPPTYAARGGAIGDAVRLARNMRRVA